MMRPVILSTVSCLLVLGTIATTCISLELARRRLEHDKDTKRGMMDLEYLKFEHEKEKLRIRKTALTDSLRQRAEHKVLRMSKNSGITHVDASEFIQSIWDGFLEIEAISGQ